MTSSTSSRPICAVAAATEKGPPYPADISGPAVESSFPALTFTTENWQPLVTPSVHGGTRSFSRRPGPTHYSQSPPYRPPSLFPTPSRMPAFPSIGSNFHQPDVERITWECIRNDQEGKVLDCYIKFLRKRFCFKEIRPDPIICFHCWNTMPTAEQSAAGYLTNGLILNWYDHAYGTDMYVPCVLSNPKNFNAFRAYHNLGPEYKCFRSFPHPLGSCLPSPTQADWNVLLSHYVDAKLIMEEEGLSIYNRHHPAFAALSH